MKLGNRDYITEIVARESKWLFSFPEQHFQSFSDSPMRATPGSEKADVKGEKGEDEEEEEEVILTGEESK